MADIVVLDDDLDFRNYIEDCLKDESIYTVRTFATAGECTTRRDTFPCAVTIRGQCVTPGR